MKGWVLWFSFSMVLSVPGGRADEREHKVAVASQGKTAEALVAPRAARAPYFLLFGKDGGLLEVVENPQKDVGRGAAALAAELLARKEVTLLVAGTFGGNMVAALDAKAIGRLEFTGKVGDAVKKAMDDVSKPDG